MKRTQLSAQKPKKPKKPKPSVPINRDDLDAIGIAIDGVRDALRILSLRVEKPPTLRQRTSDEELIRRILQSMDPIMKAAEAQKLQIISSGIEFREVVRKLASLNAAAFPLRLDSIDQRLKSIDERLQGVDQQIRKLSTTSNPLYKVLLEIAGEDNHVALARNRAR